MPVFTIQTPSGHTLDIEAPDENTAMNGAQKWHTEQLSKPDGTAGFLPQWGADLPRSFVQGATFGTADEIQAGLNAAIKTPYDMYQKGTLNPLDTIGDRYNTEKAKQDALLSGTRERGGALGTAAEIVGGVTTGSGLARAGLTFSPKAANAGLVARSGAMAADAAGYGGATGFAEGSGLDNRLSGAAKGAEIGAATGGALPVVGAALKPIAAPFISNFSARYNPAQYAKNQTAKAIINSGRNPAELSNAIRQAQAEGQGVYTLADELGSEGKGLLSSVTNAPGPGRDQATRFLEGRQFDAPRRLQAGIQDAFDSSQTAVQTRAAMEAARSAEADVNYGAARQNAGAVNVNPAIQAADNITNLGPGISNLGHNSNIADNTIESVVGKARSLLTDGVSQVSDFNAALIAKQNIDDMIGRAAPNQQRVLIKIRDELDNALVKASKPYEAARDKFAQQSKEIGAIDKGNQAAKSGRYEDTIPAFQKMPPNQQQPFRTGYADSLITGLQGRAMGPATNVARPFQSPALQQEIPAFAVPGKGDVLGRQITREDKMAQTLARALHGSTTIPNSNEQALVGLDPSIFLEGGTKGLIKKVLSGISSGLNGYTPAVREELARLLLAHGNEASKVSTKIESAFGNILSNRRALAGALLGGGAVGVAGH